MIRSLLVFFIILSCDTSSTENKTKPNPDTEPVSDYSLNNLTPLPQARQEIYPNLVNNKIFVVGGFSVDQEATKSLFIYDIQTNSWSQGSDLPEDRHHIGINQVGNAVYAFGGYIGGQFGWTIKKDVFKYDLNSGVWTRHDQMLSARGEFVSSVIDDKVYIIAGTNDDRSSSVKNEMYNPADSSWTVLKSIPTARNSAAVVTIDNQIYVIGGRYRGEGSEFVNVNTVERYNTESNTWDTLADLPYVSAGLMASHMNGKIYVFGGEIFTTRPERILQKIFEYNIESNIWTEIDGLTVGVHGTQAIHYQNQIYIVGGANKPGFGAIPNAVRFNKRF